MNKLDVGHISIKGGRYIFIFGSSCLDILSPVNEKY